MLIHRLTSSDAAILDRIRRIYVDSIPPSERKPDAWLKEAVGRSDYSVLAALSENEVIGFGILFLPSNEPMALLEYFAVDAKHRSRGIGSEMLSYLLQIAKDRCVLAEVETDCGTESTIRRQAFYRRLGFRRVIGLEYQLPINPSPPPMDLLLLNPPNPLQRDIFASWLQVVFRNVYGKPADDPRLVKMITGLSDPISLE
jgi:ribosomal protein S18 acetylase RimI-like enzyme